MSAATQPTPAVRRGRRWVWPVAVLAAVVLAAVLTALLAPDGNRDDLDPRSPTPTGSRAVAQILRAHGVTVRAVTSADDAIRDAGAGDTIVVVNPHLLGPRQLDRLAAVPADLVLVQPDLTVLQALAPGSRPAGTLPARTAEGACSDADATAAGAVTAGGSTYRFDAPATGVGCYPDPQRPDVFMLVRLQVQPGHRVTLLGQPEVIQNEHLADEGNAALALRTLGARPTLRWYLPDPLELGTSETPSPAQLLPTWVRWVFWQLVIAVVVAMVWRARRLGRVVTEPLPVVVRSAETVEGRARLYRVSRARDRAAAILRTAALRRLARRLGAPAGSTPQDVSRLVAAATGRDEAQVRDRLLGPAPTDDAGLVALAAAVDDLEASITDARDGYGERDTEGGRP